MKREGVGVLFLFYYFSFVFCEISIDNDIENNLMVTKEYILEPGSLVNWPKGNIPFYINPEHFDNEQTLVIMTSLSLIAFKTCLKFAPVMVPPADNEHVLTFLNPRGNHKCDINLAGHPKNEPHIVILGYDCLEAPWMDRVVLRALGLPFEHNRQSRDSFIDVQFENIEQHAIPLFTKDIALPAALRALPYDVNSVMHFGDRDYSKNGHRTIIYKDRETKQKWNGPSDLDIRKLEIIYGAECRDRDRQEKLELCHMYPGVPIADRKKRSVELDTTRSLRPNPNITPPANTTKKIQDILVNLDIEAEVQKVLEDVFQMSHKALANTRAKYCNASKDVVRSQAEVTDVHGIVQVVADYAQGMVDNAINNITSFCAASDTIENYQRMMCIGCPKIYHVTKQGIAYSSTRHQPYITQSTRHEGGPSRPPFYAQFLRSGATEKPQNDTSEPHERNKRQLDMRRENKQVVNAELHNITAETEVGKERSKRVVSEANRKGMGEEKQKNETTRPRASWDSEQDDSQSSEPRDKNRRPAMKKPDYRDSESSKIYKKPNNNGREEKRQKRPMLQKSQESFEIHYTDEEQKEERSDESNGKIKRKPQMKENDQSDDKSRDGSDGSNESYSKSGPKSAERNDKKKRPPMNQELDDQSRDGSEEFAEYRPKGAKSNGKIKRKPQMKENDKSDDKSRDGSDGSNESYSKSGPKSAERNDKKKRPPMNQELDDQSRDGSEEFAEYRPKGAKRTRGKVVQLSKENEEFYKERKWPDGVVRYVISENSTNFDIKDLRRRLSWANASLTVSTCVQIEEIPEEAAGKYKDYLVIDNSPDYVTGRVGGKQIFGTPELLKGGQHRQHTAMMVMAMLGFYFELSRHDRDEYVVVHQRHIRADKLHHFEKIGADATLPLPYDYESATHPPWMYWRKLGKRGISTVATYKDKDPDGSIMRSLGQHQRLLSDGDVTKINSIYGIKCMENANYNDPKSDWESSPN